MMRTWAGDGMALTEDMHLSASMGVSQLSMGTGSRLLFYAHGTLDLHNNHE
jgi:hypothetical protein